jgi:hypothetical protein
MKSTIKLFVVTTLVTLSLSANAQGFQVGYINQTTTSSISNVETSNSLDGVQAGLTYDLSIQGPVSLNYGLTYAYLFKNSSNSLSTSNTTAHQLDLPVRLVAAFPISEDLNVFAYGGPNFSYALANKTKTTVAGISVTSDLYDDDSNISQFNLQAGVGAGLSFKKIILKVGYDWGLFDLNETDLVKRNTNALTASIGVRL